MNGIHFLWSMCMCNIKMFEHRVGKKGSSAKKDGRRTRKDTERKTENQVERLL